MSNTSQDLLIEPITNPADFLQAFHCVSEAFGRQTKDALWLSVSPGWDTPQGQREGAARYEKRWKNITTNRNGDPNTVFVKASLPIGEEEEGEARDGQRPKRRIVGLAIWQQASFVEGYGDPPTEDLGDDLVGVDPTEQRFASQMFRSLWRRRIEYVREKKGADPPATFVLDLCTVDPEFQRRGIAGKLVQWGLDEAERRGGLEATTEGSSMGRAVYIKLGFRPEGEEDIVFEVDDEFRDRGKPPNVFLRTGIRD